MEYPPINFKEIKWLMMMHDTKPDIFSGRFTVLSLRPCLRLQLTEKKPLPYIRQQLQPLLMTGDNFSRTSDFSVLVPYYDILIWLVREKLLTTNL